MHRRRPAPITARGLVATALLMAAVPALAWALTHPAAVAALAVAAATGYTAGIVRARGDRSTTLRPPVGAALTALGEGPDGE